MDSNAIRVPDLGPLLLHHTSLRDIENHPATVRKGHIKRHHADIFSPQLLGFSSVNHGDGQLVLPGSIIMGYEITGRKRRLFDPTFSRLPVAAGLS